MKASLMVVACDGVGCVEALAFDDGSSWRDQLEAAGWECAADGADLCGDCAARERRRQVVDLAIARARPRGRRCVASVTLV